MCKMRETEPRKDPPLTLRPQTKWNISGEARTGGSLVLAPPHPKNFGFSFSALALAALALPLEKQTSAVPHSPAGLTRSFPLGQGEDSGLRTPPRGSTGPGDLGGGRHL